MEKLKDKFLQDCWHNNQEGVRDCLSRGVDVNSLSEDGRWSGLTIATRKNYLELVEIFLSHPQIKIDSIKYALGVACSRGKSAIVTRLVQVPGLDINFQDEGVTLQHTWLVLQATPSV